MTVKDEGIPPHIQEMLAAFSHELRRQVSFSAHVLHHLVGQLKHAKVDEKLYEESIDRALLSLGSMMTSLDNMYVIRNDTLHPHFQKVRANQLLEDINQIVNLFRSEIRRRGVNLSIRQIGDLSPETTLQSDKQLYIQVLHNLLSNAIEYSIREGTVEVCLEKIKKGLCFRIRNNSPKVSKRIQEQILKNFNDEESQSANKGHTGFGLVLSKKVCSALGWQLSIDILPQDFSDTLRHQESMTFEAEIRIPWTIS